jgi:argininosuccinate synthase
MTDTQQPRLHRVVLADSGRLDTAAAIRWLAAEHHAEVIAVTVDLGQKKEWLEEVRDTALAAGAVRAHVVDVRDEFARDYLVRGLKAGLLAPDPASATAALAGPLIAQTLASIARIEQARTIAHGDPDGALASLAKIVHALDPGVAVISVPASRAPHPEDGTASVRPSSPLPAEPASVDIAIDRGVPTAVNGVAMPWGDLVGSLNIIARAHGLGPSALTVVDAAHQALRKAALPRDAERFGASVAAEYRRMLADGSWFSPMRSALDAYVDTVQQRVGGVVRLKLFNGTCTVVSCQLTAAPAVIPVTRT